MDESIFEECRRLLRDKNFRNSYIRDLKLADKQSYQRIMSEMELLKDKEFHLVKSFDVDLFNWYKDLYDGKQHNFCALCQYPLIAKNEVIMILSVQEPPALFSGKSIRNILKVHLRCFFRIK